MTADKSKSPINIDVGAKASFDFSVKTEVPSQSSGRLVDSLTDLIRPFSEKRGLKADLIRLQREEVLIEIAKRARARIEIENRPVNPLPNKFLVPFLEKASLEEMENEKLINLWADLLKSASLRPLAIQTPARHLTCLRRSQQMKLLAMLRSMLGQMSSRLNAI